VVGIAGQFGRFPMQRVTRQADGAEQPRQAFTAALLRPIQRRALRVGVDQRDALTPPSPFPGKVKRQRRLADATLLIEEGDNHLEPPD